MQGTVLEPEELAEVIAPRGPLVSLGGRHPVARAFRFVGDRAMLVAETPPVRCPIAPFARRGEDPIEVVGIDPVRHKPWLPVAGGEMNAVRGLERHRSPRSRRSATAAR